MELETVYLFEKFLLDQLDSFLKIIDIAPFQNWN